MLKTDNFVNLLRSMQFSKILYKEFSALGINFNMIAKIWREFFVYLINNGGFAQMRNQAGFVRGLTSGVFWTPSEVAAMASA